ncbi:MAG: hypothetical protein ACYTXA_27745 [Nostoc sp.]
MALPNAPFLLPKYRTPQKGYGIYSSFHVFEPHLWWGHTIAVPLPRGLFIAAAIMVRTSLLWIAVTAALLGFANVLSCLSSAIPENSCNHS